MMYHLLMTTQPGGEVPMPRYDEVTQRAGSLRAMTGLTEPEFTALLPHFERALAAYLQDRTIDGQARTAAAFATMFKPHATDGRSTTLLVGMMALHGRSTARPIPKSHKHMTAARRSVTRSTTS